MARLKISPVGDKRAARATMMMNANLNFFQRNPAVTKPNMDKKATITGISKISPKPRIIMLVILRYSLIVIIGECRSEID